MAASRLPAPGTPYGPCLDPQCGHADCALTRRDAARRCRLCERPIGYETRVYRDPDQPPAHDPQQLVHAACLEELVAAHQ